MSLMFTFILLAVVSVEWHMTAALPECDVIPVPQDVSGNLTTCNPGHFNMVISWQWPYNWSVCNGTTDRLAIHMRELSTGTIVSITNIPPSATKVEVLCGSNGNLKCGSFYSMIITLQRTESAVIIFGGPSIPTVGVMSEKVIHLSWSPFSLIAVCDGQPNVSYTVTYHGRAHCGYETPHNSIAALQGNEYTFEDLEAYTNYTFNLTMYPGGMSVITNVQTLPAAPTGKPQIVIAKNVTDTTVELTWDREDCLGRNGEITGYVVQYLDNDDVITKSIVLSKGQSCTIDSLSPSTSYMFQVAAVNANGTGPLSEPYCVTTPAGDDLPTSSSSAQLVTTPTPSFVSVPRPDNHSSTTDVPSTTTVGDNECSHNGGGGSSTPALAVTSAVTVTTVLVSGGLIVIICYQKSQIRKLRKQLTPSEQQSKQNTYLEEDGVDSTANPAYGKLEYQQQDSHLYDRVN